ncbi:MAG: NAD(P)/FAD-dependent oxidoreductase [Erysipelotrichaceae bacterium]|nr:NAD(P)/FAD-dependent oxidoreductase [Erysipelotrichaceae bacterium]
MHTQYDVIVVGAGNGGLACAATTAKAGLKTLLLEKHNLPGGCASSFVRGRFEFEPSLHELCMVGDEEKPDLVYNIFRELGAEVNWCYERNLFRAICKGPNGYDVTLKAGKQQFIESFEQYCPGSREKLENLFKLQDTDNQAIEYIYKMKGKPNALVMAFKYGDFMRMASHSVKEVLEELGFDEKAVNILSTYWGYLGVPADELSAFHYFNMMTTYINDGAAMPKDRSHELSLALVKVIEDHGSSVWYNAEVTQFLYDEQGKAIGVEINHQQKLYAKEIVSNIMPNRVANLSKAEYVPERTRKLMNARRFGISTFTVYLGLDCTREQLGFDDYTVFISEDPDSRKQYDTKGMYIVNCLNKVIEDSSPEGTCTLFITALLEDSDLPDDLDEYNYEKFKTDMAEKYIVDAEKVLGLKIREHIEEIEIATPVTMARYLGTPAGTIYGYRLSDWDNLMARTAAEQADITVPNLNYVGGHYIRGDGYNVAYYTGNLIGGRLVRKYSEYLSAGKEQEVK